MMLTITAAHAELLKVFHRKKYRVLLILQSALCILLMLLSFGRGIPVLSRTLDLPAVPYVILNAGLLVVLPLMIFMMTADLFSGEAENGSMKAVLLRPVSRMKIFFAKILAIAGFVLLNLLLIWLIAAAFRTFAGDFSAVFPMLTAYVLSILPMLPVIAMSALAAQKIGNASLAIFVSLVLYVGLQVLGLLNTQLGAALFTTHFEWYKMFLGFSIPWLGVLNIFFLLLSSAALMLLGGGLLFERNEL